MTTRKSARRMSSRAVRLGALGALSLALVGCGSGSDPDDASDEVQAYCVDRNSYQEDGSYLEVDEDLCDDDDYRSSHAGAFFWYYGGVRAGSRLKGGTTVRPKGAHITTAKGKTIQRGGFGNRSSSSGS